MFPGALSAFLVGGAPGARSLPERHDTYGTPYSAMAVSVPDGSSAQEFANVLARDPFRIPVVEMGREGVRAELDAVRIGTMNRFKGLEFQRVFLTSVGEGQVPHQRIEQYRLENPDRYRQEEQRARSLVCVAATRARDELIVTWSGKASRFLPRDADETAYRATDLLGMDRPRPVHRDRPPPDQCAAMLRSGFFLEEVGL